VPWEKSGMKGQTDHKPLGADEDSPNSRLALGDRKSSCIICLQLLHNAYPLQPIVLVIQVDYCSSFCPLAVPKHYPLAHSEPIPGHIFKHASGCR